jgi:tRNA pseudouridine38-40 synthase
VATYKLVLAYDGTRYAGWQRQPEAIAVQNVLDDALFRVTGEQVRTTGSSRTDAGVHAFGQVVSLSFTREMSGDTLRRALNAVLPDDVLVRSAAIVADDFDAIRATVRKRYRYLIRDGRQRGIFDRPYTWHVRHPLDAAAMHAAAQALVGEHDFASFQSVGSERQSTVRTIYELRVARGDLGLLALPQPAASSITGSEKNCEGELIAIEVEGNGFLYNMVRAIAGTLVEVGRGKQDSRWPAQALAARNRAAAGPTAPAHGLFLMHIETGETEPRIE